MAWENIDDRLKHAFKVKISFPAGTVWLPDAHLTIDEWLTSLAQTDEELKELNIPRIRFLQNRWPIEQLLELEWDNPYGARSVWAMYVGRRAYILFSDGIEYHLIAAIAPRNRPPLYRAVISKLLQNPNFVPVHPTNIKSHRLDLMDNIKANTLSIPEGRSVFGGENFGGLGGPVDWMHPGSYSGEARPRRGHLSKMLAGWVGKWINLPMLGSWHGEEADSIKTSEKGKYEMKYKPTYGDKQRDEQKRRKEEQLRNRQVESTEGQKPAEFTNYEDPKEKEKDRKKEDRVA